jgi:hypothetical protein
LTSEQVRKHLPKSDATIKGHLQQQRQNLRSTQATPPIPTIEVPDEFAPNSDSPNPRTHEAYAIAIDITAEVATDLTGRFPVNSSRGYKYMLVLYEYDSNAILVEPLTDRSELEHIRAYNKLYNQLAKNGFTPKFQMMDNEALRQGTNKTYGPRGLISNSSHHIPIVA